MIAENPNSFEINFSDNIISSKTKYFIVPGISSKSISFECNSEVIKSGVNIDNFNPNSPESYIALSLTQDAYNDQSEIFAQLVQEEFASLRRKDRGVKQAGFVVLSRTFMPRVLVELGLV